MPVITELFKNQQNDLYDNEKIRIESRGLVNPPRAAALLASSPNAIGDLIGGQLAGTIGGIANRPSDTIYGSDSFLSKPVSIRGATTGLLQNAVEAETPYYVKTQPSPIPPLFGKSAPGGSTTAGTIANQAVKAINTLGSKKAVNSLAQQLKANRAQSTYGPQYAIGANGKTIDEKITNSEYKEKYSQIINPRTKRKEYISGELIKRDGKFKWDDGNSFLLKRDSFEDDAAYKKDFESEYKDTNQVPVLFRKYGNKTIIPFVGTISGISEDITPEWQGFQYVGSPFKNYRYNGVERSLKFGLKLYYFELMERTTMIKKINYLKSLAFPYDKLSEITYGQNKATAQYAFSPNLVYLTIGELYKNVFGYIESLSFSIQDNTTWANFDGGSSKDTSAYPSIIDVSLSMKIIENHTVNSETKTFKYNFDGRGDAFIKETAEPTETAATTDANGNSQNKPASTPPMAPGSGVKAPAPVAPFNPMAGIPGF